MERSLVQILVTVAITQTKILRIEVEKGFRWTSIEPELVEPNMSINFAKIEQMDGLSFHVGWRLLRAISRCGGSVSRSTSDSFYMEREEV